MPDHKVRMFDPSSRLSDSITDRMIEKELQNSVAKSEGPGIHLIDEAKLEDKNQIV